MKNCFSYSFFLNFFLKIIHEQIFCLTAIRFCSSQLPTSKTCHSDFLHSVNNIKLDDYDYIDDDYSVSSSISITDPLIKCYHRHIREHISSMFIRYSRLFQLNQTQNEVNITSLLITESKGLVVAGHKLVFVLETLHEHLRHSTKIQQIRISLTHLTQELCDALAAFIRSLKQFCNENCTNIQKIQHDTRMIMNVVQRIKVQCNSI